ncbi:hypothetical protein CYMTET_28094 [Cymbomonas tetramitiformis]|uniref:EF-hand domain-containing protein n=1 Tax=Cymbomonas tetramitiformis TaxID=36881 RepID=A0AAE0FNN6_9CHLO|nr:hypothetical protein CYMTET_28094 [Cymbomonas tetramitiformis]
MLFKPFITFLLFCWTKTVNSSLNGEDLDHEEGRTSERCEEPWGFLPCSDEPAGMLFLISMYGYTFVQGAHMISDGCESFLHFVGPGLLGGFLLPVVGALPEAIMICTAGRSTKSAEQTIAVCMGTIAGSTVFMLSIALGSSTYLGRCDLDAQGRAINGKISDRSFSITKVFCDHESGVTISHWAQVNCRWMLLSSLLVVFVMILACTSPDDDLAAMIGCVTSFVFLLVYLTSQVLQPVLQSKKAKVYELDHIARESIYTRDQIKKGGLSDSAMRNLFVEFDKDASGTIDAKEFERILVTLSVGAGHSPQKAEVDRWMESLYFCGSCGELYFEDFKTALIKWYTLKMRNVGMENEMKPDEGYQSVPFSDFPYADIGEKVDTDDVETTLENADKPETKERQAIKGGIRLVAGITIVVFSSQALVQSVTEFANAVNLPAFIVSFLVSPFAANAPELFASHKFAAKKTVANMSISYSHLYGSIVLNNSLGLGLCLLNLYFFDIPWVFTAEAFSFLVPIWIAGYIGLTRTTYATSLVGPMYCMKPLSLLVYASLRHLFGNN